jgi:hypothetical protein
MMFKWRLVVGRTRPAVCRLTVFSEELTRPWRPQKVNLTVEFSYDFFFRGWIYSAKVRPHVMGCHLWVGLKTQVSSNKHQEDWFPLYEILTYALILNYKLNYKLQITLISIDIFYKGNFNVCVFRVCYTINRVIVLHRGGQTAAREPHAALWNIMCGSRKYVGWAPFGITIHIKRKEKIFKLCNYLPV